MQRFVLATGIVLDLVPDALSQTIINSFIKFISRRGCPQFVLSDNGSPFIANNAQQFVANHTSSENLISLKLPGMVHFGSV